MAAEGGGPLAARRGLALASVRVRATLGAVVVGGIVLVLASVALVAALHELLMRDVRTATQDLARAAVAQVSAAEEPGDLTFPDDEDRLIQVRDADGAVIAASPTVEGLGPISQGPPGSVAELPIRLDDEWVHLFAVTALAETADGRFLVVAARPFDDVLESTQTLTNLLAVGIPLLLVVVALTTWWVVDRALAPVEAIRREVDGITAGELHRRVPVPASGDEIAGLARTMNRMLARLEDSQLRQRRFVSDASHELRSPIASIRQQVEVAQRHPDRVTLPELADAVLEEDLRLQRLTEDLLLLARADEGTGWAAADEVDLDDLVAEEARRLRADGRLAVDLSGIGAGRVRGDAALLRRMVGNLVDNAARHAWSRVAVGVREDGSRVVLQVDDDGPGIPDEQRERVFERFVRLDDARSRDGGGAGLGLAIVAEVAAAHGGRASVRSSPLGGARLEVNLPAAPSP
jgi:signal transduction histidine kinase